MKRRTASSIFLVSLVFLSTAGRVSAQADLTIFVGAAYPLYDERLTLRPSVPSLPGADVAVSGSPEITATGGLVVGGALAFEAGVLGIEGRIDSTAVAFDLTGARYDVRATSGPFQGLTGSVTVGDGQFDADRFQLLSINARLRTPGPICLVVSGGFSYLPNITITGSVPLSAEVAGFPIVSGLAPRLRLEVAPGESDHRFGVNGGAGLRIGGSRVAIMGEVRVFYFREYELRFNVADAPAVVEDLLEGLDSVRFEPVIVNAQLGSCFDSQLDPGSPYFTRTVVMGRSGRVLSAGRRLAFHPRADGVRRARLMRLHRSPQATNSVDGG